MVAEIHRLQSKPVTINWMCSACGLDAGCNCGAPLMSKAQRAAKAIAENPQMSDRAIAREIGVGSNTVRRARETAPSGAVDGETRIGRDGKTRRMPVRDVIPDENDDVIEPATLAEKRNSFLMFSNEALAWAEYHGPVDGEILEAARATAEAWCRLVADMEQRQ